MNEVKIITAFTPAEEEPHVLAEDDAAIYQSIAGVDGVMKAGNCLKCKVMSNNKVRILDGVFEIGGHFARIPSGSYVETTVTNGAGGQKRHDIVVATLKRNAVTGDTVVIETKRGTPSNNVPKDPELIQENIYEGGKTRELPLYRIILEGINIKEAVPMFEIRPSLAEIKRLIEDTYEDLDKYFVATSAWTINRFHAFRQGNMVHVGFMISTQSWQPDTEYTCFTTTLPKQLCPGGGLPSEQNVYSHSVIDVGGNGTGALKNVQQCTFTVDSQNGAIKLITPPSKQSNYYFWTNIVYDCK